MVKIRTNNKPRPILYWHELTPDEKKEFCWDRSEECNYVRYKGNVYCISHFIRLATAEFSSWDGYQNDSFFSGTLVKYCEDSDYVIMGWYYS